MQSSTDRVFGTYELLERILLHIESITSLVTLQRVCRTWKAIIQDSPTLQSESWYRPWGTTRIHIWDSERRPQPGQQTWKLNPVFSILNIPVVCPDSMQEFGGIDLKKRFYDKPGSWTSMYATQPPCRRLEFECWSDYSGDETMCYLMESRTDGLLLGEVMAILAECQNRQECGVDRWAGVRHYTGTMRPVPATPSYWDDILDRMAGGVSVKVAVAQAWGSGEFPAFSLRRLETSGQSKRVGLLYEMIVHEMTHDGHTYAWRPMTAVPAPRHSCGPPVCKEGKYEANLLAVRSYEESTGYLASCSDIFRLLSSI